MRVLVTGAAGFIGSHVCDHLLAAGDDVVGVDCFTDYYPRALKERNLAHARDWEDLAAGDVFGLLEGIDVVIHLAAQPGVRHCFGDSFKTYVERNVLATQRLLEEAAASPVASFIYASSSSVYGDAPAYPTSERTPAIPVSPYGMTKVAAEQLAGVYLRCYGVPVVGLRYFTVYGPRQRPDMAFHRFIARCLDGDPIQLLGDGRQVRDFTYVADAVEATVAAAARGRRGGVYNIGGGRPVELREAIALIGELVGAPVEVERRPAILGEARRTGCDGTLALRELGFAPRTPLTAGIGHQLAHMLSDPLKLNEGPPGGTRRRGALR
jgi:nucleoside-diphosphate-sugar epimerase